MFRESGKEDDQSNSQPLVTLVQCSRNQNAAEADIEAENARLMDFPPTTLNPVAGAATLFCFHNVIEGSDLIPAGYDLWTIFMLQGKMVTNESVLKRVLSGEKLQLYKEKVCAKPIVTSGNGLDRVLSECADDTHPLEKPDHLFASNASRYWDFNYDQSLRVAAQEDMLVRGWHPGELRGTARLGTQVEGDRNK